MMNSHLEMYGNFNVIVIKVYEDEKENCFIFFSFVIQYINKAEIRGYL